MAMNEHRRKSTREMLALITLMTLDLPVSIDFQTTGLWLTFDQIAHAAAWAGALEIPAGDIHGDRPSAVLQRMWVTGEWHGWPVTLWAEQKFTAPVEFLDAETVTALKKLQESA